MNAFCRLYRRSEGVSRPCHTPRTPSRPRSVLGSISLTLGLGLGLFSNASQAAAQTTIHVPAEAATIQAGLDAASSGDSVVVAPGTYFETALRFKGKDVILMSSGGRAVTTIDGSSAATVFLFDGAETRAAVVKGFTIRNGLGKASSEGGCITIRNGSSPTIQDNVIESCRSGLTGGAIKASGAGNPAILDNLIQNNSAAVSGGGIHLTGLLDSGGSITDFISGLVQNNDILSNSVDLPVLSTDIRSGGGVKVNFGTDVFVRENLIQGNSADYAGGGVSVVGADVEVTDNTIVGNTCGHLGAGVHFESQARWGINSYLLKDNDISNNTVSNSDPTFRLIGGAINTFMENTASTVEIAGNTVSGNSCTTTQCTDAGGTLCCWGGGLAALRGTATLTLRDNMFADNTADLYGAVHLNGGTNAALQIEVEGNVFQGNQSRFNYPGATCLDAASCHVRRNSFIGNFGQNYGGSANNAGALYVRNVDAVSVENNFFSQNEGDYAGAVSLLGSDCPASTTLVRSNTFYDNTTLALSDNLAATLRVDCSATIANNIFEGDRIGVRVRSDPITVSFFNNDFYGFSTGVTSGKYTHGSAASLNGETFASSNVELAPDLLAPPGDYRLSENSVLIGLGDCAHAPAVDREGDPRPTGPGCEIGADEVAVLIFVDGFESGDTSTWTSHSP